ncbi:MAG: hypothetical protein WC700_04135 [Gemmatimonadaceae bacterium]|jgi:hypothetical protein
MFAPAAANRAVTCLRPHRIVPCRARMFADEPVRKDEVFWSAVKFHVIVAALGVVGLAALAVSKR